jgi:tetratricopeptide (TPR) repeat protein
MLYSIIPPILIVISLVGIIIFLIKKAPEVASLRDDDLLGEKKVSEKKGFWARFTKKGNQEEKKDFKHRVLLFLEKMTKKLKVMFLKLENMISAWGDSFRNKRQAREEEKSLHLAEIIEAENFSEKEKKENEKDGVLVDDSRMEKVKPRIEKEKRDIFENILVERIAANPKDVEAYERLGEYYLEIENNNYAKECFKQVLKLNPQNENIKSKMRKLERMLGK